MFSISAAQQDLQAVFSGVNFSIGYGADRMNVLAIFIGLFIVFFLPNTSQILRLDYSDDNKLYFTPSNTLNILQWRPSMAWGLGIGAILAIAILSLSTTPTEFIYFQF